MRTPALLVAGVLALGACAEPAVSASSDGETVDAVCADATDLVMEIGTAETMLRDRWVTRTDDLGIRAAAIGTPKGDDLMEGLAALSVGIDLVDVDMTVDGLDKIAAVCL